MYEHMIHMTLHTTSTNILLQMKDLTVLILRRHGTCIHKLNGSLQFTTMKKYCIYKTKTATTTTTTTTITIRSTTTTRTTTATTGATTTTTTNTTTAAAAATTTTMMMVFAVYHKLL